MFIDSPASTPQHTSRTTLPSPIDRSTGETSLLVWFRGTGNGSCSSRRGSGWKASGVGASTRSTTAKVVEKGNGPRPSVGSRSFVGRTEAAAPDAQLVRPRRLFVGGPGVTGIVYRGVSMIRDMSRVPLQGKAVQLGWRFWG